MYNSVRSSVVMFPQFVYLCINSPPPPSPPEKKKTEITKQICWLLSANLHTANMCKNVWADERLFLSSKKYMMYSLRLCFLTIWHKSQQRIKNKVAAECSHQRRCSFPQKSISSTGSLLYTMKVFFPPKHLSVFHTTSCLLLMLILFKYILIFDLYSVTQKLVVQKCRPNTSLHKSQCSKEKEQSVIAH